MANLPFLVYKSSAGSGKTFTLVKEYLRIILQNPQKIRNILAITFTNAAAAEMKQRIIEALGGIASLSLQTETLWDSKSRNLVKILSQETSLSTSEVIQRAQFSLTLILHNYGDFNISTIDSFVHRIIRSFAFDLHLPLNFDVELDQDQLLMQAVDLLVSRAGDDPALTRLLVQFIESRTDEEKTHYIEYEIAAMARTLLDEKGSSYIGQLKTISLDEFSMIYKQLAGEERSFEQKIIAIASEACRLIADSGLDAHLFFQGNKGIASYFARLVSGNIAKCIQPNSFVIKTIHEDKWTGGKTDANSKAVIESIKENLKACYFQIMDKANEGLNNYKIQALVRKNLFPMAVLSELEKVLDDIKAENALLPISDFNRKISEIVSAESAPFIYERIGERYQHYMIDEFQDTSGLQWQNLLPLIDNALASGHLNLIVGDGKQAIYRWRNGDVEQFAQLPVIDPEMNVPARELWQASLMRNYQEVFLDTNYRSRQQIVTFNNAFFHFSKKLLPENLEKIYAQQEQKHREDQPGGYVQIAFVKNGQDCDYISNTLNKIISIVEELRSNGHPLSDITLLCRSNKEASNTARFLLENGLNVISSESLLLNQSARVNFMVSIMHLLANAEDEVSFVEFAQFLVKSNKIPAKLHDTLLDYKPNATIPHPRASYAFETLLHQHGISFSFVESRHLGLYELAETIIQHFFAGEKIDPFVAFFMDVIYEYSNKYVSSTIDFLLWWEVNSEKYSVVVPEGVDAIQVMTIHKSKGLQFPVVIYPFVDRDLGRLSKKGEWVDLGDLPGMHPLKIAWIGISKALEGTTYENLYLQEKGKTCLDILNMVYVAFTRAVDKLFILSRMPDSGKFSDNNLSGMLHNFLQNQGRWNDDQDTYDFGENFMKSVQTGNAIEEQNIFSHYISEPWFHKISVRSRQAERNPQHNQSEESSGRGSWMHDIMEKIHCTEDVDHVLGQLLFSGLISEQEKTQLSEKISSIIGNQRIAYCYGKDVQGRNECSMYDSQGNFLRADRIVFHEKSVTIIDYKTGKPYPDHTTQINQYASVLGDMGYTDIKKFLVYLDHANVKLV